MSSLQLGYDAIKTVVQYMSAEKRSQISAQIPSLRTVNRVTPLTIDTLAVKPNRLEVDGTTYQVGICREAIKGSTPSIVQVENRRGGLRFDIDQYGIRNNANETKLFPGDISVLFPSGMPVTDRWEERLNLLEGQLEAYDCQLREVKKSSRQYQKIKEVMEKIKEDILPLQCRKANRPSPYKALIQMTKTSGSGGVEIEKVEYTKTLPEAMKAITKRVLGDKRQAIRVRSLEIGSDHMILRLPENLKLNVEYLKIGRNVAVSLQALAPILDGSVLETLECSSISEQDLELPLLKAARSLVISDLAPNVNWLAIMTRLETRKVTVKSDHIGFDVSDYIELLRTWMVTGRPEGTRFSFGIGSGSTIQVIKAQMRENFEENVVLPMSNGLKVEVSFEKKSVEEQIEQDLSPWIMMMEVV